MLDMIRKLLSSLNSSEYSWQLSLAIALGMIVGLSPQFNLHIIIFYLLAFLIAINLGLFFVSVAVFAAISYLFDPLMESFGYYLLTLPELESLHTTIYNNPLLALFNLNDSLVLGSLISGLILFLPLFFAMQQLVKVYRGPISRITGKIPLIKSILSFDEEKAKKAKKPSKVRWWGLAVFVVLTVPITVFAIFFMDSLIKSELQKTLSEPVGREASVGSVQTSLFPLTMTITNIVVPDSDDEMKNSFEVARVAFDLDLARVFHKKLIINEMSISGVVLEGARKSPSKKLAPKPKPAVDEEEAGIATKVAMEVADNLPDPKELLANEKLASDTEAKEIEKRLDEIKAFWESKRSAFDKSAFDQLESEYAELEAKAKKLKNEKDLKALISDAKKFQAKINATQKEYKALSDQFAKDSRESNKLIGRLKELPNEDFKMLKDKYSLDSSGAFNVAEALLGNEVMDSVKKARKYYNEYMPYFEKFKETKSAIKGEPLPKPERGKGRVVKFVEFHPTPKWHLKKLDVGVTTKDGDEIAGLLINASSNQKVVGKTMQFAAQSIKSKGYKSLEFAWNHDRLDRFADLLSLKIKEAEKSKISANKLFMDKSKVDWDFDVAIKDGKMLGDGKLGFKNTKLGVENPKGEMEKLVDRTLKGVDGFDVSIKLSGKPFSPKVSLKTDLDNQLKARFAEELKKAQKEFEAKLKSEIEKNAKAYLEKAGASAKDIERLEKLISGQGKAADLLADKTGKNLSEKALEDELKNQLKAEQKKQEAKLKDEAKDKAKSLIKKLK